MASDLCVCSDWPGALPRLKEMQQKQQLAVRLKAVAAKMKAARSSGNFRPEDHVVSAAVGEGDEQSSSTDLSETKLDSEGDMSAPLLSSRKVDKQD